MTVDVTAALTRIKIRHYEAQPILKGCKTAVIVHADTDDCPLGAPGDAIVMCERWARINGKYLYRADFPISAGIRWCHASAMPDDAVRIRARVTATKRCRVSELEVPDTRRAGADLMPVSERRLTIIRTVQQYRARPDLCNSRDFSTRSRFGLFWNFTHKAHPIASDPDVWLVDFRLENSTCSN